MAKRDALMRFLAALYRPINRFIPWHRLPARPFPRLSLRLWNLPALREDLRERNLYDTSRLPVQPEPPGYTPPLNPVKIPLANPFTPPKPFHKDDLSGRRADGAYTDLQCPTMARVGSRYSRNFPFEESYPKKDFEHGPPTPRRVSEELMLRDSFRPATTLNILAAAWIQFMVHDWARHITDECPNHRIKVPLDASDNWPQPPPVPNQTRFMEIDRTLPDETRPPGCPAGPPTFRAEGTFWWDGSQIYGSDPLWLHILRSQDPQGSRDNGKLKLTKGETDPRKNNRLPDISEASNFNLPPHVKEEIKKLSGLDLTGFPGGWWAGLSALHTLFAREHNAICDMLVRTYNWGEDERLFQTARLINAALIAKIHTVEWTPAILGMPILQIAMDSNWWGVFGKKIHDKFGRLSKSESFSGIPGSPLDHHGVPFAFTEEFVSVYRLHPLIPDEFRFHSLQTPQFVPQMLYKPHDPPNTQESVIISNFDHIQGLNTRRAIDAIGMENVIYSFGLAHPGAITLRNYPHFLRNYRPPESPARLLDVATIDILRDRERGVPRYNRFRELLRMPRVKTFEELSPKWAAKLKEIYQGDIDLVDPMVGMMAEEPPEGFGFSDTAFRIFILMASRRLKSDRFFTTDYREEIYTKAGLAWINDNGFERVLTRHYPGLARAVRGLANPFHPWQSVH